MKIEVLYFAGLRDAMGRRSETVELEADASTLGEVRAALVARGEPWASAFGNLKP